MFESPPVDLAVLRRLDSTQVDHTNQGDSFLRVRGDVNAIANAAADEIEALRSVVRLLVEGVSATCAEVHIGRRKSPWVPVSDAEFVVVERALDSGRNDHGSVAQKVERSSEKGEGEGSSTS